MRVFKFRDKIEFDVAYVIAPNQQRAIKIMETHTDLPVELVDCRSLDELPKANEHYQFHGAGIWISNINPF